MLKVAVAFFFGFGVQKNSFRDGSSMSFAVNYDDLDVREQVCEYKSMYRGDIAGRVEGLSRVGFHRIAQPKPCHGSFW